LRAKNNKFSIYNFQKPMNSLIFKFNN